MCCRRRMILERYETVGHVGVPCVRRFGKKADVGQLKVSDHAAFGQYALGHLIFGQEGVYPDHHEEQDRGQSRAREVKCRFSHAYTIVS